MALAIGFIISKGKSPEPVLQQLPEVEISAPAQKQQIFARPSKNPVKEQQLVTQKLFKSKVAKFQKQARSNTTNLVPTKAHEFHNPNAQSLKGKKKEKAAKAVDAKKKPLTEADKKKAEELARSQEFMKEQCGDIKSNEEKAECHQAVAFYLNQQKKQKEAKERAKKAKAEQDKKNNTAKNEGDAPDQTDKDNGIDDNQPAPGVVPVGTVTNEPQTVTPNNNDDNSEDERARNISEWRDYMEDTSGEDNDLLSKAAYLVAALSKSGKDSISQSHFRTLMKEYYLESGDAELELVGINNLNTQKSLLSFRTVVEFLNQETIASNTQQLTHIEEQIRAAYQTESQLSNLNIFLNTFALPTVTNEEGETTTTPWDKKDPLFLTIQYINNYSTAKLANLRNAADIVDTEKEIKLIGPLTSIQSDLTDLIAESEGLGSVTNDATNAQTSITALLELINTYQPAEENTETTNTNEQPILTNFSPR